MEWKIILAVIIFLISAAILLYTGNLFIKLLDEVFTNLSE